MENLPTSYKVRGLLSDWLQSTLGKPFLQAQVLWEEGADPGRGGGRGTVLGGQDYADEVQDPY